MAERPQALVTYIESMLASRELPVDMVLTGHGDPITDHVAVIDERLQLHRRRAERMQRMLEERPLTAHEIAVQMWGNVAVTQAFLTLSEVLGHMDLLTRDGRARELQDGEVVRFEALGAG
jgi:glyoxylase-like metal-dependent hydrolase (beta-lactamase superfamily II)